LKLERIYLHHFRNYTDWEKTFPESGAVLLGSNGCGKTNLFEAITYCSLGKSIKYNVDDLLIHHDTKAFHINADFTLNSGKYQIQASYSNNHKRIRINQIPVKILSQIYEYVKVVYCSPEDIYLVNGSPRKRRRYLDLAIAQLHPSYITFLRDFIHILEQRNNLLKDISHMKQKKHWDDLFMKAAIPIIEFRQLYCELINSRIKSQFDCLFKEAHELEIFYTKTCSRDNGNFGIDDISNEIKRLEKKEWQYQRTLIGPHLDDYVILYKHRPLIDTGSQGQKRTITLLMKIAQLEMVKEKINDYPILLLDDVFAELDERHTSVFMEILKNHDQIFIATPNKHTAELWKELPVIELESGE